MLTIENIATIHETHKAQFVVREHEDSEKNMIVQNSTNLKQQNIRAIISLETIYGFRLWTQDISKADLRRRILLTRDVYVKPRVGSKPKEGTLLNIIKKLYGLTDSGEYWHSTMAKHLEKDLLTKSSMGDLACFATPTDGKLNEMIGMHVGNSIGINTVRFIEEIRQTAHHFESKAGIFDNITFAGTSIDKQGSRYFIHQRLYTNTLKLLTWDCTSVMFRAGRHEL